MSASSERRTTANLTMAVYCSCLRPDKTRHQSRVPFRITVHYTSKAFTRVHIVYFTNDTIRSQATHNMNALQSFFAVSKLRLPTATTTTTTVAASCWQHQQTRFMSKYISKSAKKRLPLTTKRAGKGFYKGKGGTKEGRLAGANFIVDPLKRVELIMPEMEGFKVRARLDVCVCVFCDGPCVVMYQWNTGSVHDMPRAVVVVIAYTRCVFCMYRCSHPLAFPQLSTCFEHFSSSRTLRRLSADSPRKTDD